MKTVCIVDSSEMLSDVLELLIEEASEINVIGTFKTAEEFIKKFDVLHPDLTLIDLDFSAMLGAKTIRAVKIKHPEAVFLVLTNSENEPQLLDAIKAGAKGFLIKKDCLPNIVQCISDAIKENNELTERLISKLINYLDNTFALLLYNKNQYTNSM